MDKYKKLYRDVLDRFVTDDAFRIEIQTFTVCMLFGIIALIMFFVNLNSNTSNLMKITGVITVFCIAVAVIIIKTRKSGWAGILIGIAGAVLTVLFLRDGGIDGFSPFWMCLVPFVSFFIYGFKKGLYFGLGMFVMIAIILWTPVSGFLLYQYSDSFISRFPILYGAGLLIASGFEFVRYNTFLKLKAVNRQLEDLTRIDELTQIENRRSFNIRLNELWELFSKNEEHISMILIDIDFFKNYNDTFGHLGGDKALKDIAEIIHSIIRKKSGFAARWGGEEFAVLLPFCNSDCAKTVGEEILSAVRLLAIPHSVSGLTDSVLTVSAGAATAYRKNIGSSNELVEAADRSLYIAKNSGRDRIVL